MRARTPWLLLAPSIVFMLLLFGWPLVQGILAAFRVDGSFSLANWARMWNDAYFARALRNTIFANHGYLNSFLSWLGVAPDGVGWLDYDNPAGMLFAVVVAEVWRATSLVFVILVAGLQMVPRDYDEAAQVFGASAWQRLWHVTLPMIRPSLQVALILRTILAIQVFAVAQALTGRNFPLLVGETYQWYVNLQNAAVASALALVVLAISLIMSVVYLRTLRRERA